MYQIHASKLSRVFQKKLCLKLVYSMNKDKIKYRAYEIQGKVKFSFYSDLQVKFLLRIYYSFTTTTTTTSTIFIFIYLFFTSTIFKTWYNNRFKRTLTINCLTCAGRKTEDQGCETSILADQRPQCVWFLLILYWCLCTLGCWLSFRVQQRLFIGSIYALLQIQGINQIKWINLLISS